MTGKISQSMQQGNYNIVLVNILQDLIDVPTSQCGGTLSARGYYFVGDGGWNTWDWDGSSLLAHNLPYIVQPSDQPSSNAGRWILRAPSTEAIDIRRIGGQYGTDSVDNAIVLNRFAAESDRRYERGEGQMTLAVPGVSFTVASTVTCKHGFNIVGLTAEKSVFHRITDYGHTFVFGAEDAGGVQGLHLSKFSILHPKPTEAGGGVRQPSCHFVLYNCSNCIFDNVHTEHLARGWEIHGGSRNEWRQCSVIGYWDNTGGINNEMFGAWCFLNDIKGRGHPQTTTLIDCSISGHTQAPAPRTFKVNDVTRAINDFVQNIGPFFGIYVESCEQLAILGGYIGSCYYSAVRLQVGTTPLLQFMMSGPIYVDGCGTCQFSIFRPDNINNSAFKITIGHEVEFVGADNTERAIMIERKDNDQFPVVREFRCAARISGHLYAPVFIQAAQGFDLGGSRIYGWNRVAIGAADFAFGSPIWCGGVTSNGSIKNVSYGGGLGAEPIDTTYRPGTARPDGTYAANQNAFGPSFERPPSSMQILIDSDTVPSWNVDKPGLNGPPLVS